MIRCRKLPSWNYWYSVHKWASDCPARLSSCNYCQDVGHYTTVWEQERHLRSVRLHALIPWRTTAKYVRVTVNGQHVSFKDSAAGVAVISEAFPGHCLKLHAIYDKQHSTRSVCSERKCDIFYAPLHLYALKLWHRPWRLHECVATLSVVWFQGARNLHRTSPEATRGFYLIKTLLSRGI